jgi:hypothetical protein
MFYFAFGIIGFLHFNLVFAQSGYRYLAEEVHFTG